MTTALLDAEARSVLREKLREHAERIEELVEEREERGGAERETEERYRERKDWYYRVENAVLDLCNVLPEGTGDYEARKLFEFMTQLRRAVYEDKDVTDPGGALELARMRMLDVLHRMGRRIEHRYLDDPQQAADVVFKALAGAPASDFADLLGVSTKTLGKWRDGSPPKTKADRVVLVAQLLSYILPAMTPRGAVMWFRAPQDRLDGKSPLDMLNEDVSVARPALTALARGGRAQLAD